MAAGDEFTTDVFAIDMHDDGLQVWVEANQAVVTSPEGTLLKSGHQRPRGPR